MPRLIDGLTMKCPLAFTAKAACVLLIKLWIWHPSVLKGDRVSDFSLQPDFPSSWQNPVRGWGELHRPCQVPPHCHSALWHCCLLLLYVLTGICMELHVETAVTSSFLIFRLGSQGDLLTSCFSHDVSKVAVLMVKVSAKGGSSKWTCNKTWG